MPVSFSICSESFGFARSAPRTWAQVKVVFFSGVRKPVKGFAHSARLWDEEQGIRFGYSFMKFVYSYENYRRYP